MCAGNGGREKQPRLLGQDAEDITAGKENTNGPIVEEDLVNLDEPTKPVSLAERRALTVVSLLSNWAIVRQVWGK